MPRIRDLLAPELILLDVVSEDMEGVCRQLVERLVEQEIASKSDVEELVTKILTREEVASTALGLGVACPHVFHDPLTRPAVLLARLKEPIDLQAPDGIPTDLVFLLAGKRDDAREHLESLMQLARLVQGEGVREVIRLSDGPTGVSHVVAAASQRIEHPEDEVEEVALVRAGIERRTGRFAGGVIDDIKRRLPHYKDDYLQGLNLRSFAATVFLFFACFTGAVTFGALTAAETGGAIGTFEMIVATALCGVVYAAVAGQPLVVLGGTGPILIFTALLYRLSGQLELPFLPFYAWVGLWSAGFTILLAVTDASVILRHVTRFTDEIFVILMAVIFIEEALRKLVEEFQDPGIGEYASALSAVVLAAGTFGIAIVLREVRRGSLLRRWARNFLADFGIVIAILAMTVLAFYMKETTNLHHVEVPSNVSLALQDHAVALGDLPGWAQVAAAIPAVLLTILIFLTQQITAKVVNAPEFHLQKGPGYHLDLLVIGLMMVPCSLLGLPWLCAATVRSLNHVAALSSSHAEDKPGRTEEVTDRVLENRLSGVGIHVLVGLALLAVPLLKLVPMACLYGVFLYMGVVSFAGNQFWQRVTLWVRDPNLYPPSHYLRLVPTPIVHAFTAVQFVVFVILWVVKVSVLAILFPLVLAMMVPSRQLLGGVIDERYLLALDAEETPEDEIEREAE